MFECPGMDDDCLCCYIVLIVLVSLATGVPCLFYGYKCKNAELRSEHKSDHCKNIHNDDSAKALQAFGWIFSIPWLIAALYIVAKLCDSDNSSVSPETEREGGGSVHVVVCFWKAVGRIWFCSSFALLIMKQQLSPAKFVVITLRYHIDILQARLRVV